MQASVSRGPGPAMECPAVGCGRWNLRRRVDAGCHAQGLGSGVAGNTGVRYVVDVPGGAPQPRALPGDGAAGAQFHADGPALAGGPPGSRVAGLARAHAGPRAVQCLLRTGRRRLGRQSRADRTEGAVVDYVGLGPVVTGEKWAFINLADLALVAGVVWLGVLLVLRRKQARSSPGRASTHA